ncbi:PAS domain S-box protein [Methanospirillum sp.]|uniref:hybrid sensor histidine kinase/response regulator n=1 Tax=Methanospirillum sp. TaxID=45200 RepID=UPI002B71937E|nr:PAS domain S-box protein [Methanospirillum sp.]HPP78745.1 PAS domain S-box protein [Methanospirillum sp.]
MDYSLLFVDDDSEICEVARAFLEKTGPFKVTTSDTVKKSQRLLKKNHYDAIISDYDMPVTDGISFLKSLRSKGNKIPFVILTGKGNDQVVIDALNSGADLYFVKTDSPKDLFYHVSEKLVPLIKSRQAEIIFHEIFTQSPIAIELYNSDGKLLQVNTASLDLFGIIDPKEISLFDLYKDPNVPEQMLKQLRRGERIEYTTTFDFDLVKQHHLYKTTKSGTIFIQVQITPISLSYPDITGGYLVQIQDLTDQKRSEDALKSSEARYRSIFSNSHSVMLIINPENGAILDANPAACSYYGYTHDELTHMEIMQINCLTRDEIFQEMERARKEERNFFYFQHRLASGEIRDVEVHSGPIVLDSRQVLYSIIHDITDKKRIEEALVTANKKLNMLSSITRHDILNVLTALTGYLEFAATETSMEETRMFIQKAQTAARSIRHHIEFTRDYQDLGSKEPVWHDIRVVLKNSSMLINTKSVSIEFDTHSRLLVLADPLLVKVIYNLMENAIRHGGHVTKISSYWKKTPDNTVQWIIEDDGVGISPTMKKHIFSREVGKNTGLGLFLAREILAITGITIEETGIEGRGAQFTMTIPEGKYRIE